MPGRWRERSTPPTCGPSCTPPAICSPASPRPTERSPARSPTPPSAAPSRSSTTPRWSSTAAPPRTGCWPRRGRSRCSRAPPSGSASCSRCENLAPVYPGPETVSANPLAVRALARRLASPAVGLCLDVGHANVIAGLRRTSLHRMVAPVLDMVCLFHVHDNLGARWRAADQRPDLDPLRLDLHLPPGEGSINWFQAGALLRDHGAPMLLEVHPPRGTPRRAGRLRPRGAARRKGPVCAYECLTTMLSMLLPAVRQRSMPSSRAE